MALRSEIIAILASGITYSRMLYSYWLGGIILGLLLLFASSFVIPKANANGDCLKQNILRLIQHTIRWLSITSAACILELIHLLMQASEIMIHL